LKKKRTAPKDGISDGWLMVERPKPKKTRSWLWGGNGTGVSVASTDVVCDVLPTFLCVLFMIMCKIRRIEMICTICRQEWEMLHFLEQGSDVLYRRGTLKYESG
jgi:hypothetical protein